MRQALSLLTLLAVGLAGCGVAPSASVAPGARSAVEASALTKFTAKVGVGKRFEAPFLEVTARSVIGGHTHTVDSVTFTEDGNTGSITPLLLGADGKLYLSFPTQEPRVHSYHPIGHYQKPTRLTEGATVQFALASGAKFKNRSADWIPVLGYSYIMLKASPRPMAVPQPTWVQL